MSLVSLEERQMSPDTQAKALRIEFVELKRYCVSQLSLIQKDQKLQQAACNECRSETRQALQTIMLDLQAQKRLDADYRKASSELAAKHNRILKRLLERIGCGDE